MSEKNTQNVVSMSGTKQKQIKVGELVLFDKYFGSSMILSIIIVKSFSIVTNISLTRLN